MWPCPWPRVAPPALPAAGCAAPAARQQRGGAGARAYGPRQRPPWALALLAGLAAGAPCPEEGRDRSRNLGDKKSKVTVKFANQAGVDLRLVWVSFDGLETNPSLLPPGATNSQDTFPGHLFRARTVDSATLVMSHMVPVHASGTVRVSIEPCEGMDGLVADETAKERWPEFASLVHDAAAPCVGPSSNWSCVRYVSPEEVAQRNKTRYGYHADELAGTAYKVGQTVDHLFSWQAEYLVNVTPYEGGYLKMEMTDNLKKLFYPWYKERKMDSLRRHEDIPGGFTNINRAFFDIIPLSEHQFHKAAIMKEMQKVLEWWTKMRLQHSETFGVRIYRRNSMLVNHLDRQETHVASAVLQIGQKCDEDGGWPLEVIHPHRPGRKEVYLQPGQMVLYEGARITHGRPMRFRGQEFGNVFTHFAPVDWYGLDRSRPNPHFKAATTAHGNEL